MLAFHATADLKSFGGSSGLRPRLHEDMIKIRDVSAKVRQIAIKDIGRDEPTLLITHDLATPPKTCSPATPSG